MNKNIDIKLLVFCIAFFLRLVWLVIVLILNYPGGFYTFDSHVYSELADNLFQKHAFGRTFSGVWFDEFFRTPLYPFFLACFKGLSLSDGLIIFTQIIISSLSCFMVSGIALKLNFSRNVAILAGLIIAADFASVLFSCFLLTETVFTFLIVFSVYHFLNFKNRQQLRYLYISGTAVGLAILCRPSALLFAFLLIPVLFSSNFSWRKNFLNAAWFLIFVSMIISPWMMRNKILSGKIFVSTSMQELFYFIPAAHVYANENNLSIADARMLLWNMLNNNIGRKNMDIPSERIPYENKLSRELVKKYPIGFMKEYGKGIFYFFFKPARGFVDLQLGRRHQIYMEESETSFYNGREEIGKTGNVTLAMMLFQIIQVALMWIAFVAGTFYLLKNEQGIFLLFLLLPVIYFSVMVPGSEAECRFRVPAIPFAAIGAALGIRFILQNIRFRKD